MISRERLQTRFLEMIQVSSPSKKEKDMVEWLERYFTERGISFRTDEAGQGYGGNGKNLSLPAFPAHCPASLSALWPTRVRLSPAITFTLL